MALSINEVQHVARLARIGLTPQEEERFQKDLASIFDLIEELKEAKLDPSLLMSATSETNRIRTDVAQDTAMAAQITKNFPDTKDGFNKVRSVF